MIKLKNLTKIFSTPHGDVTAADKINMSVPEGEICVLLGPSGCGKTTTLKMINRIIPATSGQIYIDGKDTSELDSITLRRNIGYVIQQIGLFPNMTIEENIALVPKLLKWPKTRYLARAAELLDLVGLDPKQFLRRFPKELSGGQQQRVGVIRALAANPPVMLMDEPFGAIDPINRESIQNEFLKMQQTLKKTILFVSHDIDEAVKMADKIAIFDQGKLVQFDAPDALLSRPANQFVEDFVGKDRSLKRLQLIKVNQLFPLPQLAISEQASPAQAQSMMEKHNLNTIPVLDKQQIPKGIIHQDQLKQAGSCANQLQPIKAMIHLGDDLRSATSMMLTHGLTALPCIDDLGKYCGTLSQKSISHYLALTKLASAGES